MALTMERAGYKTKGRFEESKGKWRKISKN